MAKRRAFYGIALALAAGMAVGPAQARNLYFDMWCQEQGHDKSRCDDRRAEDVAAFEDYWRAVEKYEERFVVEQQNYKNFRDELNGLDESAQPGFRDYDPERSPRPDY